MHVDRIPFTTREAWHRVRAQDVTASVIGALVDAHDYQTYFGLYGLKAGLVAEDPTETPAMKRGRLLESVALQLLAEERPTWRVEPGGNDYLRAPVLRIGATPDGYAVDPVRPGRGAIQIKTTSDLVFRQKWKTEDVGLDLPLWIAAQALTEAKLSGCAWACVALLVVGNGLDLHVIDVPLHEPLWDRLVADTATFWRRVETRDAPPPEYGRDGDAIRRMWPPDPNAEVADLTGDNALPGLADERAMIAERIKTDGKRKKEIDAEFIHKLNGAAFGRIAGDRRVEMKTVYRKAYSVAANSHFQLSVK